MTPEDHRSMVDRLAADIMQNLPAYLRAKPGTVLGYLISSIANGVVDVVARDLLDRIDGLEAELDSLRSDTLG